MIQSISIENFRCFDRTKIKYFNPTKNNMKKQFYFLLLVFFTAYSPVKAQDRFDNAVAYLNFIGVYSKQIQKDMLSYSAAVAHDKSARKIENRRQTLMGTIDEASRKINYAVPFNNDKAFRDSVLRFLKLYTYVLKDRKSVV